MLVGWLEISAADNITTVSVSAVIAVITAIQACDHCAVTATYWGGGAVVAKRRSLSCAHICNVCRHCVEARATPPLYTRRAVFVCDRPTLAVNFRAAFRDRPTNRPDPSE